MEESICIRTQGKVKQCQLAFDIFSTILVFCVVFMFKVVSVVDSSMVVGVLLAFLLLISVRFRHCFFYSVNGQKFMTLSALFLALVAWIFIALSINGGGDLSFIKTLLHLYIQFIICYLLFSFLKSNGVAHKIPNYLLAAFIIQSIIIVFGIINSSFRQFLLSTKSELEISLSNHYGFRGASLSGSSFFGLAISFGAMFIVYFYTLKEKKNNNIFVSLLTLSLLTFASLSAGRTAIIGLFFAILFFIITKKYKKKNRNALVFIKRIFFFIIFTLIVLGTAFIVASDSLIHLFGDFGFYITEFFTSSSGGMFRTTSTDSLKSMFIPIEPDTFFIGDGIYTTATGYYMKTDSGLMRPILYAGLPCLILLTVIQIHILNIGNMFKKDKKLFVIILLYLLVIQIKGEVLGFSIMINTVLILFSLSYNLHNDVQCVEVSK